MTRVGDRLTCYAEPADGRTTWARARRYTLRVVSHTGEVKLVGELEVNDHEAPII